MFTDIFNLAGEQFVTIFFSFITVSMEANEDFFLEVSTNGGGSYTIVKEWNSGVEFQNNTRYFVSVDITGVTWSAQSRLRLRNDASANDDRVYIDEVLIRTCDNHFLAQGLHPVENIGFEDPTVDEGLDANVILSPNPVSTELRIEGVELASSSIAIVNTSGGLIFVIPSASQTLDVSTLVPGLYFLRIEKDGQVVIKRFVKD
jgi:hypothetical protein